MANLFQYLDYKEFLKNELQNRVQKNSNYSLRAFARDMNISFSRLSEIITKNVGMHLTTVDKISVALKMSEMEKDYFHQLVILRHGRNKETRNEAQSKIEKYKAKRSFQLVKSVRFNLLSKWYYLPLIELLTLTHQPKIEEVSRVLAIEEEEVIKATQELSKYGFLVKNSGRRWIKAEPFIKIESAVPSQNVRNYHRQLISESIKGLAQPIENRKFLSAVFSVKKEDISLARKDIEEFNQKFLGKYTSEENGDAAYGFCVQLFQLGQ